MRTSGEDILSVNKLSGNGWMARSQVIFWGLGQSKGPGGQGVQGLGPSLTENMIFIPAFIWLKASSSSFIALRNRDLRVFELKPG